MRAAREIIKDFSDDERLLFAVMMMRARNDKRTVHPCHVSGEPHPKPGLLLVNQTACVYFLVIAVPGEALTPDESS